MRLPHILTGAVGLCLVLWGLLGLWAASFPEEGVPTEAFWRSGLIEVALGVSLVVLAWRLRLRAAADRGQS